jgi:hypothetical protein
MKKNKRDFLDNIMRKRERALAGDAAAQHSFRRLGISPQDLRTLSDADFALRVFNNIAHRDKDAHAMKV